MKALIIPKVSSKCRGQYDMLTGPEQGGPVLMDNNL